MDSVLVTIVDERYIDLNWFKILIVHPQMKMLWLASITNSKNLSGWVSKLQH
jgi:hypothetical protein